MSSQDELIEMTYIRAVNLALDESLASDERVLIYGEDVAIPNGPFGATKGLHAKYGDRVFDTPISESAMIGAALGAAMGGMRPVVEIMYADFLLVAMDQIVNQIANSRYVSEGRLGAPLVIRTQQGSTPGSCAQHSQSLEAMFAQVPGLRIAVPATPQDSYAILRDAVLADDPVMIFESRRLYPVKGSVQKGAGQGRMGQANLVRSGTDVTVVAWGTALQWSMEAADQLAAEGISCEVLDLRWISPWDQAAVLASAARTGHLAVVHEANRVGGFGAEIVSTVLEELGSQLRGAIRIGAWPVPMPSSPTLSAAVLPNKDRIVKGIQSLIKENKR
jgi:pyruvate/2-oxoglutarate/acetoin dehydrogenase E1 component